MRHPGAIPIVGRVLMLLVAMTLGALVTHAVAAPISYTHTGFGAGTIGGTPFDSSPFVISATGDTSTRQSFGSGFSIDNISASITIDDVGTFTFVTGTRFFVNNTFPIVGFSRSGLSGTDLYDGPADPEFATWDMLTSIGPTSGETSLGQWTLPPVDTTGGVLVFDGGFSEGIFQAIVGDVSDRVPVPPTLLLLALGLGLLLVRWHEVTGRPGS